MEVKGKMNNIPYILIALATMLLGLVGMLPYLITGEFLSHIHVIANTGLLCVGAIMLAFCR